jgi:hypothetical protein
VCAAAGDRCEICGRESFAGKGHAWRRPDCHEVWSFEDADGRDVQRLARLIALCPSCHSVQHAGRALDLDDVAGTLCEINGWSNDQAWSDIRRAFNRFQQFKAVPFDLDLRVLIGRLVVPGFEDLVIPATARARLRDAWRTLPAAASADSSLFDLLE